MNYSDVVSLALSYSDREDDEVVSRMDNFLNITEARVNRKLRVFNMSIRATLAMADDQVYYGLPPDFGGLRDVEVVNPGGAHTTLTFLNPEQLNGVRNRGASGVSKVYYNLNARQIQIFPPQPTGYEMEIVYYQKLVPLGTADPINWLSDTNPDVYIFGLCVEISSFVKDKESALLCDGRFKEALEEIQTEDSTDRWSGPTLETRNG